MITVEEIPVDKIDEFWDIHYKYLIEDEIITDDEDKEYFQGNDYRDVIKAHMIRTIDRHHMVYFIKNHVRIGAAQYNIYQSKDGKCFILDFWVFPEFRGNGTGHQCFQSLKEYTRSDGAAYYEINCDRKNAQRFWMSNGFVKCGKDEWGVPLMEKRFL